MLDCAGWQHEGSQPNTKKTVVYLLCFTCIDGLQIQFINCTIFQFSLVLQWQNISTLLDLTFCHTHDLHTHQPCFRRANSTKCDRRVSETSYLNAISYTMPLVWFSILEILILMRTFMRTIATKLRIDSETNRVYLLTTTNSRFIVDQNFPPMKRATRYKRRPKKRDFWIKITEINCITLIMHTFRYRNFLGNKLVCFFINCTMKIIGTSI